MQRLQAFKYKLQPDGQQQRQMRRYAGCGWLPFFPARRRVRLYIQAFHYNSSLIFHLIFSQELHGTAMRHCWPAQRR
ncbi:helix-turn-helix domain-containing protein [Castellaniella hirudinis]|uniref:helix-turn-helix domain-containing protein n=1 Tax=Castellaniella hirudinis TaxID=1144617 RepID=UPI0039C4C2A5